MSNNKLFDLHNVNNDALIVPQQHGGTEDDTYFGSIGDATAQHVGSLSHSQRQMWQELIITRNGNIFDARPAWDQRDDDDFQIRDKDVEEEVKDIERKFGKKLDDSAREVIREEIERELAYREQSEDTYNRGDLVPYHQMELYPGMEKHVEIPSTPPDKLFYLGNTNQQFYDEFPDGHPDSAAIMSCIRLLDRDVVNDGWYNFVYKCLEDMPMKDYVRRILGNLIDKIETYSGDPDQYVKDALIEIDKYYQIEYLNAAAQRAMSDSILQLLVYKEKQWTKDAENGFNVYSSIKNFGKVLFTNYRDKMKFHHWARYRRIRDYYAPQVVVRGIDINRCGVYDLIRVLRVPYSEAIKIWHARPFNGLVDMHSKGYIDSWSFTDSQESDALIAKMDKAFQNALEQRNLSILVNQAKKIVQLQDNSTKSSQQEWRMIWCYYHILRDKLLTQLEEERQKNASKEDGFRFLKDCDQEKEDSSRKVTVSESV